MSNRLQDFHLKSYEERQLLISALAYFKLARPDSYYIEKGIFDVLTLRLSATECQPGGCPHCNEDRAREVEAVPNDYMEV